MTSPSPTLEITEVQPDNMVTIHSILKESYSQAKTHIQGGFSFFRTEVQEMYNQAETCVNNMILPVNNFLKDLTQIDTDFQKESINDQAQCKSMGNIVPIEVALLSPMEENY